MIRICLKVKSQPTKNIEVFSKGTDLRCKTLYIGDYEYVNIFSFAVLDVKLWLEEDGDLNRNDHLYIHSNSFRRKPKIYTKSYHLSAMTLYPT